MGGSHAVICEQMDKYCNVKGAFFAIFSVNMLKTCFLHCCFQYLSTFAEVSFNLWHIKNYSVKVCDAYF
jgi:hypothetical protein